MCQAGWIGGTTIPQGWGTRGVSVGRCPPSVPSCGVGWASWAAVAGMRARASVGAWPQEWVLADAWGCRAVGLWGGGDTGLWG